MRGGWNFDATFASSIALLIGKLWRGQATFEQLITPLAFATSVPTMLMSAASEWLFGVPINLIRCSRSRPGRG
jgi:hypothetical protein